MRQPHPELNFRLGKGRRTEEKKALNPKALIAAMRFVGMTDEEIKAALMADYRGNQERTTR